MESPRSTKRRKLSTSTPASTSKPTPTRASARKAVPTGKDDTPANQESSITATKPVSKAPRSSVRKSRPAQPTSTKTAPVSVYDDIEGAHAPASSDGAPAAAAAAASKPTRSASASTRAKSKAVSEKSEISTKANHTGLNSLRARLEAKVAAAAAAAAAAAQAQAEAVAQTNGHEVQAGAGASEGTTGVDVVVEVNGRTSAGGSRGGAEPPVTADAGPQEVGKENQLSAFEKEQVEKAIKRMAAKEASRKSTLR